MSDQAIDMSSVVT